MAFFVHLRITETTCVGMDMDLWKLQRELLRIGKQVREFPEDLINYFFATRRYDRAKLDQIHIYDGQLSKSDRIAIFLIFPKSGLLQSHLHTLEYFRAKGYATLVVSNLPLSDIDRKCLSENCWRIMERPNFGYDFGGYRDGLLSLTEEIAGLNRLIFINDSVWFPLPGSRDWLDDVEALDVDFAGAASNFGNPRVAISAFRSLKWSYSTNHRDFHICSFAICLRPKVFTDAKFLRFWKGLRLTNRKKRTVRRGEIGLSQWALRQSFTLATTLNVANLDQQLADLSVPRLRQVAVDLIIPEDTRLARFGRDIIQDPNTSREDLEKFILLTVSRQGSAYAIAAYSIIQKGYPFLKKSPLWLNIETRAVSLRIIQGLPEAELILEEAIVLSQTVATDFP